MSCCVLYKTLIRFPKDHYAYYCNLNLPIEHEPLKFEEIEAAYYRIQNRNNVRGSLSTTLARHTLVKSNFDRHSKLQVKDVILH
jgi:hypothetical protein